jgi:glycosyltransferase involved in cell wall biosynthesis
VRAGPAPFVCMVVYTNYATDARVRREAETLASSGFRVLCLTNRNGDEARRFVLGGVEVRELDVPKYRGKSAGAYMASYIRFVGAAAVECLRLRRRGGVDVVHAHNMPDFLVLAGLVPRVRGAKVVLDVHDSVPETFASKFSDGAVRWKLLCLEERLSALVSHRVICVNHPQRDTLVARGVPESKTFVSMNVPDPRIFPLRQQERPPRGGAALNLVCHGTMTARAGIDLLIEAVHRLRGRIPGLALHLWGNGDDLEGFRALAQRLGVADRVRFRPQGYPLEELPAQLDLMDLCVIGNRRTIAGELLLPVKLLECVALGIPAVVPRLKTVSYYFTDDMVSFYEPGDVDSMANAIARLHDRAELRREQPALARAFLREHGWDRQGPELVAFYERLVES